MGMYTYVRGFKQPDEKFQKMKQIWDSCKDLQIPVPDEVEAFFEYREPSEYGVEVDIKEAVEDWSDNTTVSDGFDIYINKLPKDVIVVRFTNSY